MDMKHNYMKIMNIDFEDEEEFIESDTDEESSSEDDE